jgi:hypothetical protein
MCPHPPFGHPPVTNRDWARYREYGAPGLPANAGRGQVLWSAFSRGDAGEGGRRPDEGSVWNVI